ncbi:hypothetical protein [Nodosilinea nodulosa]|uniref:hypothetical protein n=1 Tax=Nodosilinea nodulosa TaxID=416001 RepID=UPI0002EC8BB9|nr:hypothetical protein [Nodosilinea nodulosa]
MSLSTPVVFIIFRRPDVTAKVFEQIRLAQPKKLFIVADGPRNEAEILLCEKTRAITESIDWPCEVIRDYSKQNLGCRKRVVSGLSSAFESIDSAIILEDDCLPNKDFFTFCQMLLNHYQNDERVWMISGNNFQNGKTRGDGSYYFSRYPHCWGWATWKRAWKNYQDNIVKWPEFRDSGLLESVFENPKEINYWINVFDNLLSKGKPDSWAYRWAYACWSNSGLTILPNQNLVTNLGFGQESTNTTDYSKLLAYLPTGVAEVIHHPSFVVRHAEADAYTAKTVFLPSSTNPNIVKLKKMIKTILKKLKFYFRKDNLFNENKGL